MKMFQFVVWVGQICKDDKLMEMVIYFVDFCDCEVYFSDIYLIWVVEGLLDIFKKVKKICFDKDMGFGVLCEDLGGGYNDLIFVFLKKLLGVDLCKVFVCLLLYGYMFVDFQLLVTVGLDFVKWIFDNIIDFMIVIVFDKYDLFYVCCGLGVVIDIFINYYGDDFEIFVGLFLQFNLEKIFEIVYQCVIEGVCGDIYVFVKDDDKDVEGFVFGSWFVFYQMFVCFENMDVDFVVMGQDKCIVEDDVIDEGEVIFQWIKVKENVGKGIKQCCSIGI